MLKKCNIPLIVLLWLGFFIFGLWLNRRVAETGVDEVYGFDYRLFMLQLRDIDWITYTGIRHPGLGGMLSPVVLLASALNAISGNVCEVFLLAVFALVGAICVWLVWLIAGWMAGAIFLSFGFTWLLAAIPESFPVAMLSLLLVVWFSCYSNECQISRVKVDAIWLALFLICSAITVTNGLKVLIAYLICNYERLVTTRIPKFGGINQLSALGLFFFLSALAFWGMFAVRMAYYNITHPDSQKTVANALEKTFIWIPPNLGILGRIHGGFCNFFVMPIIPRFCFDNLIEPKNPSIWGLIWGGFLGIVALFSGFRNRRKKIVQVLVGMLSVDFFIHIVCGWGIAESWLYCAHWFWIIPIMIGLSFGNEGRKVE